MTESERTGCLTRLKPMLESLLIVSNMVLAGCTFYLAWTTASQAKATSEQVKATLDQVKASRDALEEQSKTTTQFYEGLKMFRQVVDITTENQRSLARIAQSGKEAVGIIATESLKLPEVLGINTDCKYQPLGLHSYRLLEPARCDHIEVHLRNPGTTSRFHATAIFSTQPETYCPSGSKEITSKMDKSFVIHVGDCLSGALLPTNIDFTVNGTRDAA